MHTQRAMKYFGDEHKSALRFALCNFTIEIQSFQMENVHSEF